MKLLPVGMNPEKSFVTIITMWYYKGGSFRCHSSSCSYGNLLANCVTISSKIFPKVYRLLYIRCAPPQLFQVCRAVVYLGLQAKSIYKVCAMPRYG